MNRRRWLILAGSAALALVALYFLSQADPARLGRFGINPFDD